MKKLWHDIYLVYLPLMVLLQPFFSSAICISSKIHLLQHLSEKHSLTNTVVLSNGLSSSEGTVNPERKPSGLSNVCESERISCPVVSSLNCSPYRLLCLWDSPGKNTGVGCHSLLQGIFPTQGSNQGLCRQIRYH